VIFLGIKLPVNKNDVNRESGNLSRLHAILLAESASNNFNFLTQDLLNWFQLDQGKSISNTKLIFEELFLAKRLSVVELPPQDYASDPYSHP